MLSKWLLLFAALLILSTKIQGRPSAVTDDFEADEDEDADNESGSGEAEESGSGEPELKHEEGAARGTLLDHLADVDDKALKAIAAANGEAEKVETEKETEKEDATANKEEDKEEDKDDEDSDSEKPGKETPQDPNALASKILPADLLAKEEETKEKPKPAPASAAAEKPKGNSKSAKFSIVLRQNYDSEYEKTDSTKFQMLSGNVKNDIESALAGSKITGDLKFTEGRIEGNPPTSGKTKVVFSYDGDVNKLKNLVKTGSINGLSVIKDSLEEES